MTDDTVLPFSFPAVPAKKVTAAFDGGRLTSNGGGMRSLMKFASVAVMVLSDRRFGPPKMATSLGLRLADRPLRRLFRRYGDVLPWTVHRRERPDGRCG